MAVTQQHSVEGARAQVVSDLLTEQGAVGGALIVEVLPRLPLIVLDDPSSFVSRRVLLVDGDRAAGTTALVFTLTATGAISIVYQAPGDASTLRECLPLKGGKALDGLLKRALATARARSVEVNACPAQQLEATYDRAGKLLLGRNADHGMFNTPLGSVEITRKETSQALDGSPEYAVQVYRVDLERGVNRKDGAGTISRELGFYPAQGEKLTPREVGVLLMLAEVQQRLEANSAGAAC